MPVKIFCCYAHEDETLLNKLKAHLSPLQRQGLIDIWHDRDIHAGTEWEQEISQELNAAHIILLLVSPDFMDSDYCYGIEMKRALEKHERGESRVIPIILRPVYWMETPIGKLQALPTDALPVNSWHDPDEAYYSIVKAIRKTVEELTAKPSSSPSLAIRQVVKTVKPKNQPKKSDEEVLLAKPLIIPSLATGQAVKTVKPKSQPNKTDEKVRSESVTTNKSTKAQERSARARKRASISSLMTEAYYHEQAKRFQEALTNYSKVITLDASYAEVYRKRSHTYSALHEYEKAIADCDLLLALEPEDASTHLWRGILYGFLNEYQKRIADFDRAIGLAPNNAYYLESRAQAFYEQGEYKKAIADYDRVIALKGRNTYAYVSRGEAYFYLKQYQRAIQDFERALELRPKDPYHIKDRREKASRLLKGNDDLSKT